MASAISLQPQTRVEDPLTHLPASGITEYRKGQTIFGPASLSNSIYLVITGKVGISQVAEDGSEVLLDIVGPNELFGESAFLDPPRPPERATAIEMVRVMAWPVSAIEDMVIRQPRLGVALLQILVQRNTECNRRIESFSLDTIERRLARSLIRFSERLGARDEDGSIRLMPITHQVLSQYVGTTREIVTHHMNRFRRQGCVQYSRRGIVLYCKRLRTFLSSGGFGEAAING